MLATLLLLLSQGLASSLQQPSCLDGVPSGLMILGECEVAPSGFAATGLTITTDLAVDPRWHPGTSLPGARSLGPAASLGSKIYILGSHFAGKLDASVLIFDTELEAWTSGRRMLQGRDGHQAVGLNGRVYAIGGFSGLFLSPGRPASVGGVAPGGEYLKRLDEYDPEVDQWTTRAPMNIGRTHLVATAANGKAYAIGGYVAGGSLTTCIEEYSPETDTWTLRSPMPRAMFVHGAASINGRIFVTGALPAPPFGQPESAFEEYDPSSDTWTTRPSDIFLFEGRCAAANNRIYAFGHKGNYAAVYDPVLSEWSPGVPIQGTRHTFSVVGIRGRIYAFSNASPSLASMLDVFDTGLRTLHVFLKK